jgi:hypothetical protein
VTQHPVDADRAMADAEPGLHLGYRS